MEKITNAKPIHELYSPTARKQHFPKADYRFLLHVSINLAKAIAAVHEHGCVIGDINHSSILVQSNGTVNLIDADSFQLTVGDKFFFCTVGVPEYTPPELQEKNLSKVIRTIHHDAFGLSVLIFQLLFMGRHPFIGSGYKGELRLEKSIKNGWFAYHSKNPVGMRPPPGAMTLDKLPDEISELLIRSFSIENTKSRPAARTWIATLSSAKETLRRCQASANHHFFADAKKCQWCEFENTIGIFLFIPVDGRTVDQLEAFDPFSAQYDFRNLWNGIRAIKLPKSFPAVEFLQNASTHIKPSDAALSTLDKDNLEGFISIIRSVAYVASFLLIFTGWGIIISFLIWWIFSNDLFSNLSPRSRIKSEYENAKNIFIEHTDTWKNNSKISEIVKTQRQIEELKNEFFHLQYQQEQEVSQIDADKKRRALNAYLSQFSIRSAKIKGIGPAKLTALLSYGIETAAEIEERKVLIVPGMGPVNSVPLFHWRNTIESGFNYTGASTPEHKLKVNSIYKQTNQNANKIVTKIKQKKRELLKFIEQFDESNIQLNDDLKHSYIDLKQKEADLTCIAESFEKVELLRFF